MVAWWGKSPLEELDLIVKSKHGIFIFNIMLGQEVVDLKGLLVIHNVHIAPDETWRKVVRLLSDFIHSLSDINLFVKVFSSQVLIIGLWDWL